MPAIWRDYGRFTALPRPEHRAIRFNRQWGRDFLTLAALNWIGLLLLLVALAVVKIGFGFEPPARKATTYGPAFMAALMIVIAPFFEELIFRSWFPIVAWLRKFWSALSPLFPVVVWGSTLIFALIHLTNYRSTPNSVFALAVVAPQLWSGSIFAFARVRLGFFGAFLLHAAGNAVVFSLLFATGGPNEDYHCAPMQSGNIKCTTESGRTKVIFPRSR